MSETKEDWIQSTVNAYEWLKNRTSRQFVVGLSMGGTLAAHVS
ncbi:hypothetical protein [Viridibacillus soli]|nr:hypothetical protein [Viridibacillus soli]